MKVLHLSSTDVRGGAARGTYWLHQALRQANVESEMLVGRRYTDDDSVHILGGPLAPMREKVRTALDSLPLRRYRKTDEAFWTVGWVPRHLRNTIDAIRPDIVHLHWMGAGFMPVEALSALRYPLVWTLRDMWPFTGGCHYTAGCLRYRIGCGRCPQLRSDRDHDLSSAIWQRKRRAWEGLDIWLVPISTWLGRCALQSPLFENAPVEVIPNGVDAERFRPVPRARARAAWGLDPDKRYLLFGALHALRDQRKGFQQFQHALRELQKSCWSTRAEVLVFGDLEAGDAPDLGFPARFLGQIDDDDRLAQLYAAADVMVVPSLQEAFGKTIIEAMACATPVVAFGTGGPADIVRHRETGYLAHPFDAADLARGMAWCLDRPRRAATLGRAARNRVEEDYDIRVIASRYMDLYRRILARVP